MQLRVQKKLKKYIDIIEVGTILIASEGKKAIKALKEAFPNKIIVADGKIADAGKSIWQDVFWKWSRLYHLHLRCWITYYYWNNEYC
nr:orotidine 5'-phosphate decarboxylase / HUMPS family protein [Mycoplasmopsis agalactiae]